MINLEQYAYVGGTDDRYVVAQWPGAVVVVHPPGVEPNPDIQGLAVSPNSYTRLGVKKVT